LSGSLEIRVKRVGIFTATRWEYAAVRRILPDGSAHRHGRARCFVGRRGRWNVIVVQTGVGAEKAASACRDVLREHPLDLAVSAGLACALVPAHVGDLLVGTDVRMEIDDHEAAHARRSCAGEIVTAAVRAAERAGLPVQAGSFVTASRILWHSAEKRAMADMTGAIGLDMESAALAEAAAERQVPFAIVRSVSDLVDENLPVDLNLFRTPADWLKGLAACVAAPSCLGGFIRLRAQMHTASDRMSRFFERFVDELS
jgi:adenosylhomocysteine nucleosidase